MSFIYKKTGYFNSFDGTPIYYELKGQSEQYLVFAYGVGCVMNHMHLQEKYFCHNYTTLSFDYRGHHNSGPGEQDTQIDFDVLCKDMFGLLEHLEIETAHFCGHSFGVMFLIEAYCRKPELFQKMVLLNGFVSHPFPEVYNIKTGQRAIRLLAEANHKWPQTISQIWKGVANNPAVQYGSALLGVFNLDFADPKDMEIYYNALKDIDIGTLLKILQLAMDYEDVDRLKEVHCPALIIGGEKDLITPIRYQRELHEGIKDSQFISVKHGSHCTHLDRPDFINLRMEQFFNQ